MTSTFSWRGAKKVLREIFSTPRFQLFPTSTKPLKFRNPLSTSQFCISIWKRLLLSNSFEHISTDRVRELLEALREHVQFDMIQWLNTYDFDVWSRQHRESIFSFPNTSIKRVSRLTLSKTPKTKKPFEPGFLVCCECLLWYWVLCDGALCDCWGSDCLLERPVTTKLKSNTDIQIRFLPRDDDVVLTGEETRERLEHFFIVDCIGSFTAVFVLLLSTPVTKDN